MKSRFKNRLQKARDYHLRNSIRNRWNAQRARSTVAFGNLDATYRRRKVAARRHPIPKLVEIRLEVLFKLGNRLTVDASGSPIGFDPFVRFPNITFGDRKRLCVLREVPPTAG